jgi:anti-sigma-K factor RskA
MPLKEALISALPFEAGTVHQAATEELEETAAVFAIEALPDDEGAAYQRHLNRCDLCQRMVSHFQAIADLLPNALEEAPPAAALKDRILTQARRDLRGRWPRGAGLSSGEATLTRVWQRLPWLSPLPAGAMALLVLLAVGLLVWGLRLQLEVREQKGTLAEERQLIRAIAGGAAFSQLSGTESAPGASGTLVYAFSKDQALLVVRNLPPLSRDKVYQVWSITGKEPTGMGIFTLTSALEQLVPLSTDFSGADAIGISIEPKGGSSKPTGAIVLLGSL